jgi:hypothetical protein
VLVVAVLEVLEQQEARIVMVEMVELVLHHLLLEHQQVALVVAVAVHKVQLWEQELLVVVMEVTHL